ncbi:hypothetical protein [Iningainema tapete]|uniref:Uncharacterized protein n=1 Tax=Iningainema tapete BLCC-T55 TaxID=2748662 RepID=A0A8J6Y1K5_9CYAN|nr:hypothetical protein [Iningainema tapete]MBD2777613.1 hypothetical protein [Iningainema tapete BLCC-T55]
MKYQVIVVPAAKADIKAAFILAGVVFPFYASAQPPLSLFTSSGKQSVKLNAATKVSKRFTIN